MRRLGIILPAAALGLLLSAAPVLACGGLIGPNGAVNLLRTTTFAGYHDGEEHYVTAFQFAGGGGAFGSITPLPGVPSSVVKGGDWTLQRLVRETNPPCRFARRRSRRASAGGCRRADEGPDRRARHHGPQGRLGGRSAPGPRTTASASRRTRPRSSTSTRSAQPDLPRRRLRRRCRRGARPAGRRRDAGAHHDPHRQPVGAAADPRPRQDRRGARRGRRLPDDRQRARAAAGPDRRERDPAGPQRRRDRPRCSTTSAATAAWNGCRRRRG